MIGRLVAAMHIMGWFSLLPLLSTIIPATPASELALGRCSRCKRNTSTSTNLSSQDSLVGGQNNIQIYPIIYRYTEVLERHALCSFLNVEVRIRDVPL